MRNWHQNPEEGIWPFSVRSSQKQNHKENWVVSGGAPLKAEINQDNLYWEEVLSDSNKKQVQ